jgi:hypothetical protein
MFLWACGLGLVGLWVVLFYINALYLYLAIVLGMVTYPLICTVIHAVMLLCCYAVMLLCISSFSHLSCVLLRAS